MAERSNAEGRSTSSSTDTTSTASATFWRLWKAFASDRGTSLGTECALMLKFFAHFEAV